MTLKVIMEKLIFYQFVSLNLKSHYHSFQMYRLIIFHTTSKINLKIT